MNQVSFSLAVVLVFLSIAGQGICQTTPISSPPAPVHSCAEWEESEGVILNYNWMNADTVFKMQLDHQVYIPVNDQAAENAYKSFLNSNGIPLTNIHFIPIPLDFGWMRDCGPWFIWNGDNELCIVNNICYKGAYPKDERFPQSFAALYGYKFYDPLIPIYCQGGNFYPNAYGMAFSSSWVYGDNLYKSKTLTDSLFKEWLGIEHYRTTPPWTLGHHDTYGKPANPETLIIAQWPEGFWRHVQGEGVAAYYETLESPWGRPYKILRLPMFPTPGGVFKPYLNCLVANKKVFVPITNTPDDPIALGIIKEAFIGYEIVGVDSMGTGWGASLHCATKNIMKRDVIRIYPMPPGDTEETKKGYPVLAEVIPPKGSALSPGYPVIRWTGTGGPPFNDVKMQPTGKPNEFNGQIPAQPQGTAVSFYMEAQDDGGRRAIYPLVAPDGMMRFQVRKDTEAPRLSRFTPTRHTSAGQGAPLIRTLCKDDMATPEVWIEYAINGKPQPEVQMTREELCYWYSGTINVNLSPGDMITYRVKATDNADSPNLSHLPKSGQAYCPVTSPKDCVGVVDLSQRPYTAPFLVGALGDLDIPHHHYADWPGDLGAHHVWFICLGVFPYNHILSSDEANHIVTALQAGKRIYLEGGDTWCYDPEKTLLNPWFGVKKLYRGHALASAAGAPGTLLDGLHLDYGHEVEDLCIDRIDAISPAEVLMTSNNIYEDGIAVIHDAGNYRTIASSIPLGGLVDNHWPNLGKEILIRYLDFFGIGHIRLMAAGEANLGATVPMRIKGKPDDQYLLLASTAESYLATEYGLLRLSFKPLLKLDQGKVPHSGLAKVSVTIPRQQDLMGLEIHFQAITGTPAKAWLTNREILTIVE